LHQIVCDLHDACLQSVPRDGDYLTAQFEKDYAWASGEFGAEWRSDIEAFVSLDVLRNCIQPGVHERPPERQHSYTGFVDPSGGSSDSMTLAIGHVEGKTVILDCLRETRPPFSPEAVADEYCYLLRQYRCSMVYGDRYGGEWPREQFRKLGVHYEPVTKVKGELYQDILPLLNSGAVDLLDNDRMINQFISLERRTARGGKDSVDHPRGMHDDLCNAAAGAIVMAHLNPGYWSPAQRRRDSEKIANAFRHYAKSVV
jgi:hypothetical protein